MRRDDYDQDDERATYSSRRSPGQTDRLDYDDTVRSNWREGRATRRRRTTTALPSSRQEFILWLQHGGWPIALGIVALVLVAVVALLLMSPAEPLANDTALQPTIGPFDQQEPLLQQQPTITLPPATATTAPPTQAAGVEFRVFNTEGLGLFLRPEPNTNNQPLKTLPDGAVVTIIGEDFVGPNFVWKHVRDAEGTEGWVAADYLERVE